MVRHVFYPLNMGAVSITWLFFIVGCAAIYFIYIGYYLPVLFLLPIKSIIDAADGEMARFRNRPSYVGRYLDSNLDLLLNLGLFVSLYFSGALLLWKALLAWLCWQLQGTFYNYYYVIRRAQFSGDTTSRSNETKVPTPYPYESPWAVAFLHRVYLILYGWQDFIARSIDVKAEKIVLPTRFMTALSVFGLGFQLLLFGVFLYFLPQYLFFYFTVLSTAYLCILLGVRFLFLNKANF